MCLPNGIPSNQFPASSWGNRPDLSYGGPSPGPNMALAATNAPNSPRWLQEQLAGYYAAPTASTNGVSDYGRWNWLRQPGAQPYAPKPTMQTQSYQPQQPNVQPQSTSPTQPQPTSPDPWISGQTPMQVGQPTTAPQQGGQVVPGVTPSWYDPSKDLGLAAIQNGYKDYGGGVGSADWWGAVRGDIQNQNPSANIPSWLRG